MHTACSGSEKIPVVAITWARVSKKEVDQRLMGNPLCLVEQLLRQITRPGGKDEEGNEISIGPLAGRKLKWRKHKKQA